MERPTDFSPNVSENGLVKAHSFQILCEKYHIFTNFGHTRGRTGERGPRTRGWPMAFCFICPGDICPYHQFLSCYQIFWNQFIGALIILDHNFLDQTSFYPNIFWTKKFPGPKNFFNQNCFDLNSFRQDFIWTFKPLYPKFFGLKNFGP